MVSENDITLYANSAHKSTVAIREFLDSKIVPALNAQANTSNFEEILVGLFLRLVSWCRSMAVLDGPEHFQAARTGARIAFELHLDIHYLASDQNNGKKMLAFTKVWKYHSSRKLLDFIASHPDLDKPAFRHQRALVNDAGSKEEYEGLLREFWPKRKSPPDNWSGKSIHDKARDAGLGFERRYREEYSLGSQFTHSGIVAVQDIPSEGFAVAFGKGHSLFQESCLDATKIVCQAFRLFDAYHDLRNNLSDLANLHYNPYDDDINKARTAIFPEK